MQPRFSLARGAKEGATLGLDDAADHAVNTAGACLCGAVVDAVHVLVATGIVECIAVRAIAESAAFVRNGFVEHGANRIGDPLPLRPRQAITTSARIHTGHKQYLGSVEIANARDRFLVQQSNLDRTLA